MRFSFVSHSHWAHVDLGGRSFVRTAVDLLHRGHSVRWVLLRGRTWHRPGPIAAEFEGLGLEVEQVDVPRDLPVVCDEVAIARLRQLLSDSDACAMDRIACFAPYVCGPGQPWAGFGTDGGEWRKGPDGSEPSAGEKENLWCQSPFLNVSFLPRCYWPSPARATTHFLGCRDEPSTHARDVVLVTLGTTFDTAHFARVTEALKAASRLVGGEWRFLGLRNWQPYPRAFADARLAIGHGGNAFTWQAMAEGIPVVSISSGQGDQTYGARAAARLGIGVALAAPEVTAERIADAVNTLLASDEAKLRARALRTALRSGGGVGAAARLLEELGRRRAPIVSCVAAPCCCIEEGLV